MTDFPALPARPPDAHKGTFGRVLIVGGQRGMPGAPALAARAALRSGAGLVAVAAPAEIVGTLAILEPCATQRPTPANAKGGMSFAALATLLREPADALAIGPGWGRGAGAGALLRHLLAERLEPMVLDADALNLLAGDLSWLSARRGSTVLTPHPAEFARLLGISAALVQARRAELAADFARRHRVVVVLKGQGTVVTDGTRTAVNDTGNPGMATGGSGDALTGIVVALLGQKLEAFDAARLAVRVHGQAGDLAAAARGQIGMTAADLVDFLPAAWQTRPTA